MLDLLFFILVVVAVLLFLMWVSPSFKEMIVSKTGVVGAALVALGALVSAWFSDGPPALPPL